MRRDWAANPVEGVDLLAVARSVGPTTRRNCGVCHFKGGGGDAVKHGDLDGFDVFPQRADRRSHGPGQPELQRLPSDQGSPHPRLRHVGLYRPAQPGEVHRLPQAQRRTSISDSTNTPIRWPARTCHIPRMAIDAPTKMAWDWSTAGQDLPEDPHVNLKAKGSFEYAQNVRPEYYWYDGRAYRYLTGDKIEDPSKVVAINMPIGGPGDPEAKIWPFKVHRGKQLYDKEYMHLLTPRTWGEGGFWTEFDWDKACRLGATPEAPYSGEYGFVETVMYWPLSHMVQAQGEGPAVRRMPRPRRCHGLQGVGIRRRPHVPRQSPHDGLASIEGRR